jgi:hypothetical protein
MQRFSTAFDLETLQILSRSFELAWHYLERSLVSATAEDQDCLAEIIGCLGQAGERKTVRIANLAIDEFRAGTDVCRFRAPSTNADRSHPLAQRLQGGG